MPFLVELAGVLSGIATTVGLIVGIVVYRRQTNAQVFLDYTRRYEEIMSSMPPEARLARTDLSAAPPPESVELTMQMLRYLNLSSEEFYLVRRGYLAREIWEIWEGELRRTLTAPLMRREWKKLRREFASYPEFQSYVDVLQSNR